MMIFKTQDCFEPLQPTAGRGREKSDFGNKASFDEIRLLIGYLIDEIENHLNRDLASEEEAIRIISEVVAELGKCQSVVGALRPEEEPPFLRLLVEAACQTYQRKLPGSAKRGGVP
jgi:hypothetical protein